MFRGHDIVDGEPIQLENFHMAANQAPQLDYMCRNRWMTVKYDASFERFRDVYNIGNPSLSDT